MELKYDIYTLNNAQGTGEKRQYVRIVQHEPMTEKQLQEKIQNRSSLTKGDVAAVLAELHDIFVEEFSMGCRFYIPEIGYFSMSASLEMPEENPAKKITGKEVRITGINFRPEEKLVKEVQRNVHFVRSRYSNQSTKYSEEKMLLNSATVSINRLSDSKLSLWCLGALFDCCISRDKPFHPLTPPSDLRQYAVENRQEIRISQSLY